MGNSLHNKIYLAGILLVLMFACSIEAHAQRVVRGTVVDSLSSSGLPAANAVLLNKDSSFVNGLPTDSAGHFKLSLPGRGAYILRITMTGYKTKYIDIAKGQRKQTLELGTISLPLSYVLLKGAEVKGSLSEVEANEDTISFNAEAFNVQEGEALEELIKLLPGVEVDGNTITYNGKEVTEFRVNGKDFFKGNKSVAMKNLPVDLVKRIKTYEKKSDYAEQTGIDDGNEQTVMDIVLKQELNETWIANLDGAAGSEGRYINKLFANRITDLSRLTVTGNLRNEDARSTNKQLGFDFNINNGRKKNEAGRFELGGNAGINNNRSHGESWRNAENFISSGSTSSFSNNNSYNKNRSTSANANLRLEWQPDTMTTITANKRFSIGRSNAYSRTRSATFSGDPYEIVQDGDPLGEIFDENFSQETMPEFYPIAVNRDSRESKSRRRNFSYGFNAMGVRRIGNDGRNISLDFNASINEGKGKSFRISDIHYYNQNNTAANSRSNTYTNQYTYSPSNSWNINTRISYSEPIFKGGFLQFSYRFERSHSQSDRSLYELDSLDGWRDGGHELGELPQTKDSLEMALNIFNSNYSTYDDWVHTGNFSFRITNRKINFSVGTGIRLQETHLDYRKSTIDTILTRNLTRFTPSAFFRYRVSRNERFEIRYDGWSSDPSMTNRLALTDNSDPLNIHISNGNLKPAWNNRVRFEYNKYIVDRQQNYAVNASFNQSSNNISTAIIYNERTGVRTTMPKNINGNWSANCNFTFSSAFGPDKAFRISCRTNGSYNNSVSYVSTESSQSSEKNVTKTTSIGENISLRYRNEIIEARIGGRINYRHADNKLRPQSNLSTFNYSYSAEARLRLPWKMNIGTNLRMQSRRGYANKNMNTDELIWNAEISQNFFKGSPLIIRFRINDILHERSNISRTINAQRRVDSQNDASYSYFMLHAILRLNIFNGKISSGFNRKGRR